jgi:hypothetical protein
MSSSFAEIQKIAQGYASRKQWTEAFLAYQLLEKSAGVELKSVLAGYYSLNNQSVCLFLSGKYKQALEIQRRMHGIASDNCVEFTGRYNPESDFNDRTEMSCSCEENLFIMQSFIEDGGVPPTSFAWVRDCEYDG